MKPRTDLRGRCLSRETGHLRTKTHTPVTAFGVGLPDDRRVLREFTSPTSQNSVSAPPFTNYSGPCSSPFSLRQMESAQGTPWCGYLAF